MKILHLDIEVSPTLATIWGLFNQNIAINQLVGSSEVLTWVAKYDGVRGYHTGSRLRDGKRKMLKNIYKLISESDAIVTWNGKDFDMKVLNKEFLLIGLTPPPAAAQIDLLQVSRTQFRFTSNKMDYVAQQLGFGGKLSHRGHQMWLDCMASKPEAFEEMLRYNKRDVALLEKLYKKFLPWIKNHPNLGLYALNKPVCTNCGGRHLKSDGFRFANTRKYRRYHCLDCGTWVRQWQSEPGKALMRSAG